MESNQMRKKYQKGFIQGAILVGLALLVMVVAGFSLANRSSSASTNKEQIRMNAATIMNASQKMGALIKSAHYSGEIKVANGYFTLNPFMKGKIPNLPEGAGIVDLAEPRIGGYGWDPRWFETSLGFLGASTENFGTDGNEVFSKIRGLKKETCVAINKLSFGHQHYYAQEATLPKMSFRGANWSNPWLFGDSTVELETKPTIFCAEAFGEYLGFAIGIIR